MLTINEFDEEVKYYLQKVWGVTSVAHLNLIEYQEIHENAMDGYPLDIAIVKVYNRMFQAVNGRFEIDPENLPTTKELLGNIGGKPV